MGVQNYDFAVHLYYGHQNGGYILDNQSHGMDSKLVNKAEAEYLQNLPFVYYKRLEEIAKNPEKQLIIGRLVERENEHSLVSEYVRYSLELLGKNRVIQVDISNLYQPRLPYECCEEVDALRNEFAQAGVDLGRATFEVYGEIHNQCVMQVAVFLMHLKGNTIPIDYIIPASFGREYREWSIDSYVLFSENAKRKNVRINKALCGDSVPDVVKAHSELFPVLSAHFHTNDNFI